MLLPHRMLPDCGSGAVRMPHRRWKWNGRWLREYSHAVVNRCLLLCNGVLVGCFVEGFNGALIVIADIHDNGSFFHQFQHGTVDEIIPAALGPFDTV